MSAPPGNQYALGHGKGRPSLYKPEYAKQAYKLCLLRCTDAEMALFFDVSEPTINKWKNDYQDFFMSIKEGKEKADMHIVSKLFEKAEGAEWIEQQAIKVKRGKDQEEVVLVDVKRKAAPDIQAIQFWLKNRRPDLWRDKVELDGTITVEHIDKVIATLESKLGAIEHEEAQDLEAEDVDESGI